MQVGAGDELINILFQTGLIFFRGFPFFFFFKFLKSSEMKGDAGGRGSILKRDERQKERKMKIECVGEGR